MNRLLTYTVNTLMTLLIGFMYIPSASAQEYQNTPVTVSTEKVRNNGQVFYSHIVLEKQTLYSICKAYETPAEIIYRHNPKLQDEGLKKGMILLIPIKEEKQAAPDSLTTPSENKTARKIHVRKWYEEIDDIAEKYGVTVSDLMTANGLKSTKLSNRQKLIIPEPIKESTEAQEIPEETAILEEEISEIADTTATTEIIEPTDTTFNVAVDTMVLFPKERIDVTLMLPFKAKGNTVSKNNMDFYSGVLLAVHDLKEEGVNADLNVYDIAAGGDVICTEDLDSTDLIIGPVSSGEINRYLNIIPYNKTFVSPLDPRVEKTARTCNRIVQAPTAHEYQYNDLITWLKEDITPADTVVFISEKDNFSAAGSQIKEIIDSAGITYNIFSYTILEGRDITEPLTNLMTATGVNRIIIGSDNEAFVNDVVRNLNLLVYNKLNIVLYGASRFRSFETIEAENFHNTLMKVSLGYYIDYENPQVQSFLLKYRALFNTEPTQFAFQGYDIAKYFIGICYKYGEKWPEMLEKVKAEMLQSTFNYLRHDNGGYLNTGVRRIAYGNGWMIEKVR